MFLDEPTGGVDPITRRQFWELIYAAAAQGTTVFVTTHYMDEAEYCDRISIMVDGRIAAMGTPAELKEQWRARTIDDVFVRLARPGARHERAGVRARSRAFVRKEMHHILRDRQTLTILLLMPLVQVAAVRLRAAHRRPRPSPRGRRSVAGLRSRCALRSRLAATPRFRS